MKTCIWKRNFDGHFNLGCVAKNNQRGNGHFKPDRKVTITKWDFKFCPYCGKEIKVQYFDEWQEDEE